MDAYFDEARTSLLFLRRINTIEFRVHGKDNSGWLVESRGAVQRNPDEGSRVSQEMNCLFTKHRGYGMPHEGEDKWWISVKDLSSTMELQPTTSKRAAKNVECGLAALLSSTAKADGTGAPGPVIEAQMFSTLPLTIASDLPIHIHASFSLSGDRKSIALDEYGSNSPGSQSNRYLLQNALPKLYLEFLSDLVVQLHTQVFQFWPQAEPPKRSFGSHIFESFWKHVGNSPLMLLPKANATPSGNHRILNMAEGIFDFLPASQSDPLVPLLLSIVDNLVRDIPKPIVVQLRKLVPSLNCVSGPMLRAKLKAESCRPKLLAAMRSNMLLWSKAFELMAPANLTRDEATDFDGCHILPLVDKTIGTLRLVQGAQPKDYYVVTWEEMKLFNFASAKLVLAATVPNLEALLLKGTFNVELLQLRHYEELLRLRPANSTPSLEADEWLASFWKHWNSRSSAAETDSLGSFTSHLYRATRDGVDCYLTPEEFCRLPTIVEPLVSDHRHLCQRVPGIYLVAQKYLPKTLVNDEKSLESKPSFCRFMRALATLGRQIGIRQFFEAHIDLPNITILRGLVIDHVSDIILQQEHQRFFGLEGQIQALPLWPVFTAAAGKFPLISASWAIIAADSSMLVPWMKNSHYFLDPNFVNSNSNRKNDTCLALLGVRVHSVDAMLRSYILPLPANVGNAYWQEYKTLIGAVARVPLPNYDSLTSNRIAVDGNYSLKSASEMFDHENLLFKAAFMLEARTRFVHSDLRVHHGFWLKCGLRHELNGLINPAQYLECLQVMSSRIPNTRTQDPTFYLDMKTVLEPLTTFNQRLGTFARTNWQSISQQQVFQSRSNFNSESEYQRHDMAVVAQGKPYQCLSEVISQDYISICWSQVPFAVHEPTPHAFSQIVGNGKPQVVVVWRHLQTLKAKSQRLKSYQVQDFFVDLKKTYQYLQDHIDESLTTFVLADNVVWLNISEWNHHTVLMEDLQSSWQSLDMLVLSSSVDSGPIQAVRPDLMVYEKLLRGLGCKSITYPTVTPPPAPVGYSIAASARQLKDAGKMLDITYQSQGQIIKAHRFVLAAVSDHCASQFGGNWVVPPVIAFDEVTDPDAFLSYHTLETMIKYAYEEAISWQEMEALESDDNTKKASKLDMLLNLCKGADYWLIPSLLNQAEARLLAAGRLLIDLDNVVEVRDRALLSGATHFHKLCEAFIDQNRDAVERAHSEERA